MDKAYQRSKSRYMGEKKSTWILAINNRGYELGAKKITLRIAAKEKKSRLI